MNISKKFVSLLIVCSFVCSFFSAYAEFSDIDTQKLYSDYIVQMADKGIIKGVSQNTLAPDEVCTRGQFVTFLHRASQMPNAKADTPINDLPADSYYTKAAIWAYENSVCKIFSDGSFKADLPTDREHAVYFLYNWAKYLGKCKSNTGVLLTPYSDSVDISKDSVTAFAWALSKDLIFADNNNMLNPKLPITRGEVIYSIGKLLEEHICNYGEWINIGNGTCKRECADNPSHAEITNHIWNDGELTVSDSKTKKGEITYTCENCRLTKTEKVNDITKIVTRGQLEEAIVSVAFAYYMKNPYMQYDSTHLTDMNANLGGLIRLNAESAPEYATKDSNFYSVCSDYVYQSYLEAINVYAMGDLNYPFGMPTLYLHRFGDNQPLTEQVPTKVNEPLTNEDVDACTLRWINFDTYNENYASSVPGHVAYGMFESSAFTDFTQNLTLKDDGYEGNIHYSYYDESGKLLTYDEAREKYIYPILETPEKLLRVGDVVVTQGHSILYIGGGKYLECSGSKISTKTGVDKHEANGAIYSTNSLPGPFNWKSAYMVTVLRPLELVIGKGFDDDAGNDIVKDIVIPDKTKSRLKYPAMAIDRTIDISPYGTAVKDDYVTYTVEITNKTNNEFYKEWFSNVNPKGKAEVTYNNLVVTEKVPENCELVKESVNKNATYKDGIITWKIKTIKPGSTVSLSYKVKVTGEIGTQIINNKGMVDSIPSNSIVNIIGGQKPDEPKLQALSEISAVGSDGLAIFGSDTDFAENIYASSGEELNLPTASDITKELFTAKERIPGTNGWIIRAMDPIYLYETQTEVSDEYKPIKQMLINSFAGGRRFYVGDDKKWEYNSNCIKEFRQEYLEAGDIIVYAKAKDKDNLNYDFETVGVIVYDGENLLESVKTGDEVTYGIYPADKITETLSKLFMTDKDIFFAVRPSQLGK